MAVLVYAPTLTPRLRYAATLLFKEILGAVAVQFTADSSTLSGFQGIKIAYTNTPVLGALHIKPQGLLSQEGISQQQLTVTSYRNTPVFFQTNAGILPFDVFAAAFYLASRYEEYLPHHPDHHQRFPPTESLGYKHNFLELPLVNIWAAWLKEVVEYQFPNISFHPAGYSYIPTVDIDNIFAYQGKGLLRTAGALAKDVLQLSFRELKQRLGAITGFLPDPFNTFELQHGLHTAAGLPSIYFMLFAKFGPNDRNASPNHPKVKARLRSMSAKTELAIHPGYHSNTHPNILRSEKESLEKVLQKPITKSRQHYLKLSLPQTYRNLVRLGITDDYTMGYAALPGFRASMATPFTFYDLLAEQTLPLTLHPFMLMDVTFIDYLKLQPDVALARMKTIADATRAVNGQLITVFHNRVFSEKQAEWQGWVALYRDFLNHAKP